jgi:hypothetical protein
MLRTKDEAKAAKRKIQNKGNRRAMRKKHVSLGFIVILCHDLPVNVWSAVCEQVESGQRL